MSAKQVNILQNLLILLLTVSSVFLFLLMQLDSQGIGSLATLFPSGQTASGSSENPLENLASLDTLVRTTVSGTYGRYGEIHLTSTSDGFAPVRSLLQEALGSAGTVVTCTRQDLHTALDGTSVYCDWTVPLPLSVISGLVGISSPDMEFSVRRMVVAAADDSVFLFLTDDETFYRCPTKVSSEGLLELISSVQMNSAAFAYELEEASIAPYTLLQTGDIRNYPILTVSASTQQKAPFLSALGFNPNTNSRYTESNGTEVVLDSERTLRIEPDSTLVYDCGGIAVPELSISMAGNTPSAAEAVLGSYRILSELINDSVAGLYLQDIQATGHGWLVTFDYHVNGVPLRLSSGEHAAQAEINASGVSSFTLRLRRYSETENSTLMLPLRQALAIAGNAENRELNICYVDSGSTASATWLKE